MGPEDGACTLPFIAPYAQPYAMPATPCPCRRIAMVKSLLAPYEQRPWAQTNWILVRLWRVSLAGGEVPVAGWKGCPAPLTSH